MDNCSSWPGCYLEWSWNLLDWNKMNVSSNIGKVPLLSNSNQECKSQLQDAYFAYEIITHILEVHAFLKAN